jgi:hypothetical protein
VRLVQAEILKLRRRRGTMIWCALLTIGSVVIADIVLLSLHAANASAHGPAGGAENLKGLVFLVGGLGNVAAILIGSAAGSQDVSAGVFRDLVVTGRPRSTLFNVRVPGALAVFLPMLAAAYGIAVGGAYAFSGSLPQPTGSEVTHYAIYLVAITSVDIVLAVGLAAFVSSRIVVGVLIAWNAIVSNLLIHIHILGSARAFIDVAAAQHFLPLSADQGDRIAMSSGKAVVVLLIWVAAFMAAGRFWTSRRDA